MQAEQVVMTCRFCGYRWVARQPNPKACPRCKRRFDRPLVDVADVSHEDGVHWCSKCIQRVAVARFRGKPYCKTCLLEAIANEVPELTYSDAVKQFKKTIETPSPQLRLPCDDCVYFNDERAVCMHEDYDIDKPNWGVGLLVEGDTAECMSFSPRVGARPRSDRSGPKHGDTAYTTFPLQYRNL